MWGSLVAVGVHAVRVTHGRLSFLVVGEPRGDAACGEQNERRNEHPTNENEQDDEHQSAPTMNNAVKEITLCQYTRLHRGHRWYAGHGRPPLPAVPDRRYIAVVKTQEERGRYG